MKKIFVLVLIFTSFAAFSQKCESFYYLQNNKTVEMTMTNKNGKETGRYIYTISDVKKTGGTISSKMNSALMDAKGKTIFNAVSTVKCTGGIMMMDMKTFIPSTQQEQMGSVSSDVGEAYLEYPSNMKEGDVLKDGQFSMTYKTSTGLSEHISVEITNRKVQGKESVTTPAGTWDCFKITYHSKVVMKIVVGIPINADVTEWYSPGFGVVKTESGGGKTEITSMK